MKIKFFMTYGVFMWIGAILILTPFLLFPFSLTLNEALLESLAILGIIFLGIAMFLPPLKEGFI